MKKFEYIDHTADMGVVAWGKDLKEVFANAALAVFNFMVDLKDVSPEKEVKVEVEAEDLETLLIEWINELLYHFESKEMAFSKFVIEEISERKLVAKALGEKIDLKKHSLKEYIKACTYHLLKVEKSGDGWRAQFICDV
jgi:SHS2 domain-containing protein